MCESNLTSPDYYIGDNCFVDLDIVERTSQCRELPRLNISSPITNIPHLTNLDIDMNMPLDENFDYHSITDFNSDHDIIECSSNPKSFSALNCNIRSLAANNDNFLHMLSELNFSFSLIGLSETKLKVDKNPHFHQALKYIKEITLNLMKQISLMKCKILTGMQEILKPNTTNKVSSVFDSLFYNI